MGTPPSAPGDAFSVAAPPLSLEAAAQLARELYGLSGAASVLHSERDQNFRLDGHDGASYVLKVTHPAEDPGVTDFHTQVQVRAMRAQPAVPVPELLPALDGALQSCLRSNGQTPRAVRLIRFVHGRSLRDMPRSPALRRALGACLARFDLALTGFSHPKACSALIWDIQHLADRAPLLGTIIDPEKRALAGRFLDRYRTRAQPFIAPLRRQVIHNDMNPSNVIVDAADPGRVLALFDFGDMVEAPLVQDIAVAASYHVADGEHPLDAVVGMVAAYHAALPLTETELRLLPELIAARLLLTVLITEWRARLHPDNAAYILRNNPVSWQGLRRLDSLGEAEAADYLPAHLLLS